MSTLEDQHRLQPRRLTAIPRHEAPLVRERLRVLRVVLVVADALTLLASLWLAATIRFGEVDALWDDLLLGPLAVVSYTVAVLGAFWFARLYDLRRHWRFETELLRTLRVLVAVVLATLGPALPAQGAGPEPGLHRCVRGAGGHRADRVAGGCADVGSATDAGTRRTAPGTCWSSARVRAPDGSSAS